MHKENKCFDLYQKYDIPKNAMLDMFTTQFDLQKFYHSGGMASDPFEFNVHEALYHWNTSTAEYFELVERLKNNQKYLSVKEIPEDELMEIRFELIDIFHFVMNIGIYLDLKISPSLDAAYSAADTFFKKSEIKDPHLVIPMAWGSMSALWGAMLDKLPYKKWKKYTGKEKLELNKLAFNYQGIIDSLLMMALSLDVDPQMFYNLYNSKVQENIDRQKRGY